MKRKLDLIRQLLIETEEKDSPLDWIIPTIEGFSKIEEAYHINLLIQANLIDGVDLTTAEGNEYGIRNLTWKGHEFLDAARDEGLWKKAKQKFGSKIILVSFDLFKDLLLSLAKQELGLTR